METINMHEAKTHLSKLVKRAAQGEPFVIAIAGKPMVKVMRLQEEPKPPRRLGFLKGQIKVPEDFDTMCQTEIEEMFYGK